MDLNYAVIIFWVCPQTSGNATNWQVSWPKGPSLFQWILDSSLSCNKLQFHAFPLRLFPFSFLSVASVHFWYHILWIPHFKRSNHAFQVNSSTFFQGFPIPSQPGLRLAAPPRYKCPRGTCCLRRGKRFQGPEMLAGLFSDPLHGLGNSRKLYESRKLTWLWYRWPS